MSGVKQSPQVGSRLNPIIDHRSIVTHLILLLINYALTQENFDALSTQIESENNNTLIQNGRVAGGN